MAFMPPSDFQRSQELQQQATDAAAKAIGDQLESIGINRAIRSITWRELQAIASECISGWVLTRAEQDKELCDHGLER
jgi:hypothetical protein